jgi:uncharacterized 2Fe-2S/4Fe-4S cluster protein (DUF4445 family)
MIFKQLVESKKIEQHCNGRGTCGKCMVRFTKEAPFPTSRDREYFNANQLREGYRLSCQIKGPCNFPYEVEQIENRIVTITSSSLLQRQLIKTIKHKVMKGFTLTVDLGTTTIAMVLWSQEKNEQIACVSFLNPQRKFGADVLSRLQSSSEGNEKILKQLIMESIQSGLEQLCNIEKPDKCVIVGNTAMIHLLMGYQTCQLMQAPFQSLQKPKEQIEIGGYVFQIVTSISAFVGGDITAGIIASNMNKSEEIKLLIDLGTNGEIVLGNRERMIATATAAGPAFEGGFGGGIFGSDMCSFVSELLESGAIDQYGLLKESYFEEGIFHHGVLIRQQDIRNFQLAKAAIYAGITVLLNRYQIDYTRIQEVILAGGFGYFIDVEKAVRIGLLPEELKDKTISAGNTALVGAFAIEKMEVKDYDFIEKVEVINLALDELFEDAYLSALNFKSDF